MKSAAHRYLIVAVLCLLTLLIMAWHKAFARDDGRYAQSTLKPWFDSLKSSTDRCRH